jgi:hypothetical protein
MLSDPAYPTPFSINPTAVFARAWGRMLGGGRPLGFTALLDARQDANSPRACSLNACLAWRAKPSFPMGCAGRLRIEKFTCRRLRWRSTKAEKHGATGLLTQPLSCPAGYAGRSMYFCFGRAPADAVTDDGSRAQP